MKRKIVWVLLAVLVVFGLSMFNTKQAEAAESKAEIQFGTLKIDMKDKSGSVYAKGTKVAAFVTEKDDAYHLSMTVSMVGPGVWGFSYGSVLAKYVQPTEQKTYPMTPNKDVLIVNSMRASTGQMEYLSPVNEAIIDLSQLFERIKPYGEVDQHLRKDIYTDKSKAALQQAVNDGIRAYNNPTVTQAQVDQAIRNIDNKVKALVLKATVDKSKLKAVIDQANGKLTNAASYTEASVKQLRDELTKAQATYNDQQAPQQTVDFYTKSLTNAINQLKLRPSDTPGVVYSTHVQSIGWQGEVSNGANAGTTGQAKRLEAIKIRLTGKLSGSIKYSTHVQSIGWQGAVANGALSGTSGEAKRLEAIKIWLEGNVAKEYDVIYRVHAQSFGWLNWAKNGAAAGTAGYAYRLEAIEIKLIKKNTAMPSGNGPSFREKLKGTVTYQTHVQSYGWIKPVSNGASSGTVGQAKRLEGIKITLGQVAPGLQGSIQYQTHVQTYGWQGWKQNGAMSGTSGEAKRLEGIRIRLTGTVAERYDVYYRTHIQSAGWLGWAKNGAASGSAGYARRLESIQIVLVEKNSAAPGSTANSFLQR